MAPKVEKNIAIESRKLQEKTEGPSEEKPSVKSSTHYDYDFPLENDIFAGSIRSGFAGINTAKRFTVSKGYASRN